MSKKKGPRVSPTVGLWAIYNADAGLLDAAFAAPAIGDTAPPPVFMPSVCRDSSVQTLVWLVEARTAFRRDAVVVTFGLDHLVNRVLFKLNKNPAKRLVQDGYCFVGDGTGRRFRLSWQPGRQFSVTEYTQSFNKTGRLESGPARSCTIHDVSGIWGASLPDVTRQWIGHAGVIDADWATLRAHGQVHAAGRLTSEAAHQLAGRGATLIAEIVSTVRARLANECGLSMPAGGAGALASAMLHRHKMREEIPPLRDEILPAVTGAMYGGRIEDYAVGVTDGMWVCDLRSAYPWALAQLPDMHGQWRWATVYEPGAQWALWYTRWSSPSGARVVSFPQRHQGQVVYWTSGEGWYHASEVRTALEHFPNIEPLHGWVYEPHKPDVRPWDWIRIYYCQRQAYKAVGDPLQSVLRSGMAAIAGKLMQRQSSMYASQKPPPYRNLFLAGALTAMVRARMLGVAVRNERFLMGIATDSVHLSEAPDWLDAPAGDGLGEWSTDSLNDVLYLDSGMYDGVNTDTGKIVRRTRGYRPGELPWGELRTLWGQQGYGAVHPLVVPRYVGLHAASASDPETLDGWRTTVMVSADVRLAPHGKLPGMVGGKRGAHGLVPLIPMDAPVNVGPSEPHESSPPIKTYQELIHDAQP